MIRSISRLWHHVKTEGIKDGTSRALFKFVRSPVGDTMASLHSIGDSIYTQEWDVIVVLDACRADLIEEVADDYEFINKPAETIDSVGSTSVEWLEKTFTSEFSDKIADTTYITANPHSYNQIDTQRFKTVDEVWRYGWDDDIGTVPPRVVTDRAITLKNDLAPSRMIVHYMQPHFPFLTDLELQPRDGQGDIWESLREGDYSEERIWRAYKANLRLVLDEIELLKQNIDARRMVITSDHGNAVGEYGMYGHPPGFPLTCLRTVPWIVTVGRDSGTHTPATYDRSQTTGKGW